VKKFLLSALIAAGSVGVHAEGLYVGLAAGGSQFNLGCDGTTSCDKSNIGFKLFGGYKLTDNIAVEAHYADYGKAKLSGTISGVNVTADVRLSGFGAGVALMGDFTRDWNGVVRAGIASNKLKRDRSASNGLSDFDSRTTVQGYLGAGLGYQLTRQISLNAAVDYTQGEYQGEMVNATLYTIGLNYNF
jgi:OmpA-OmpF porin, OOP family